MIELILKYYDILHMNIWIKYNLVRNLHFLNNDYFFFYKILRLDLSINT